VEFRTRPKWRVLNDLIDRLETLPANHPDRERLIRMILGLRGEIEGSRQGDLFARATSPDQLDPIP
jgi:hypothetical protein